MHVVFPLTFSQVKMNNSCVIPANLCHIWKESLEALFLLYIINAASAILATVDNSLVLLAVWRTPTRHSPSNVLIAGLALPDLVVGLVVQPLWVSLRYALIEDLCRVYFSLLKICFFFSEMMGAVTFLTLCAVSFDRFLALKLHLRYQQFVNKQGESFCFILCRENNY